MKWYISAFFVCMAILFSGCSMKTTETAITPTSTTMESDPIKPVEGLPDLYGTFNKSHRSMRPVEQAFMRKEDLSKAKRFTASEIKSIRSLNLSAVILSGCNMKILKTLVASDWVPVVILTSPVGPKHVRAVVGYDNAAQRMIVTDPVNYSNAMLKYSDFTKQWKDPKATCLLIFSEYRGNVDKIKNDLKKYLPAERVDSIQIRTR